MAGREMRGSTWRSNDECQRVISWIAFHVKGYYCNVPPFVTHGFFSSFFVLILFDEYRRTGWANLNTSIPNLEEVSSSEFPDDAVTRIEKVNEVFTKLNSIGLAPLPGLTLIPGMSNNNRNDLMKELENPLVASAKPSALIANAAEEAINAALGMPIAAGSLAQYSGNTSPSNAEVPPSTNESTVNSQSLDDPKQVKGVPSRNILVRNMFDKDEETDENWEEDIKLDFEEESSKHGKIISVKVMSQEVGGKIYASFETIEGARGCAENLAGRWFDKRQLRVEYVSDDAFEQI